MRHRIKAEDSDEKSTEDEHEAFEDNEFGEDSLLDGDEAANFEANELSAQEAAQQKRVKIHQGMINNLLTKEKTDYNWREQKDPRELKHSGLSLRAKKAQYKTPDYCFVTRADKLNILLLELDPLVEQGGILYGIYNEIKAVGDFDR